MKIHFSEIIQKVSGLDSWESVDFTPQDFAESLGEFLRNYSRIEDELEISKAEVEHLNYCISETTKDLTSSLNKADDAAKELFTLLSTIPNMVYFKNRSQEFIMANHAFESWINLQIDEIKGKKDEEVYPFYLIRNIKELEQDVLNSARGIFNYEERIVVDDVDMWLLTNISPYRNADGNLEGIITSSLDITNRKRYEMELERAHKVVKDALNIKNEFLANISHELRTPLHAISGSTEILLQKDLSAEHFQLLKIIDSSGKSLLRLIDDILFYSKADSEVKEAMTTEFDIRAMVHEVLNQKGAALAKKGVEIRIFIDERIPNLVLGNEQRLVQLFEIIVSNSVKFTEKGFIHVLVKVTDITDNHLSVRFDVIDTGIGIKKGKKDEIFGLFATGDNGLDRRFSGMGMGLPVAQKLLNLLKGKYGFESEEDIGTHFWFEIGLVSCDSISENSLVDPSELPVLLVEDNIVNQKIAFFTLKKMGFPVDIAENGAEAVEKYQKSVYKLVLMDIQMPVMNGLDATIKIRQIENERQMEHPAIIIALSANVLSNDIQHCFEVGMNEFISKPFSSEKLLERIKIYFKLR